MYSYAREINRQKPIFDFAAQSFAETIRPNAHNAELIRAARNELVSTLTVPHSRLTQKLEAGLAVGNDPAEAEVQRHHPDPYVAVHVRRGDRNAANFPYRGKYVPLENYVQSTKDTWERVFAHSSSSSYSTKDPHRFPAPPITYIASDSPEAVRNFIDFFPPSTAIFSLETSTNAQLRALAPQHEYVQEHFNTEESPEERVRLTRGMIVDLAMLTGFWSWEGEVVPGATICTFT